MTLTTTQLERECWRLLRPETKQPTQSADTVRLACAGGEAAGLVRWGP